MMTNEEIIKSLENAKSVVDDNDNETLDFFNNCIDLINRQQAEIEKSNERLRNKKHALFEQQSYTAELQQISKIFNIFDKRGKE